MDLNELFREHQLSLMRLDGATTAEECAAHAQFVTDYAARISSLQNGLGSPPPIQGSTEQRNKLHPPSLDEVSREHRKLA